MDLLKGSLQTFLNAFTYPDRTCYPVASQNTKVRLPPSLARIHSSSFPPSLHPPPLFPMITTT